ncbi:MAG: DUF3047 domain-containing protein [Methylococcales bacterium]
MARFSQADLDGWEPERFLGETVYRFTQEASKGTVLCAESHAAASGLIRKIQVDLTRTPYLNWSWKIDQVLVRHDEKTKQGDDYPARVYVIIHGGVFFWQTKAVNYVWAGRARAESIWSNPYAGDNVKMIAVESGNSRKGLWQSEKRHVIEDLERAFGEPLTHIDAVAIMTDTDNTKARAQACYGDIFFSAD